MIPGVLDSSVIFKCRRYEETICIMVAISLFSVHTPHSIHFHLLYIRALFSHHSSQKAFCKYNYNSHSLRGSPHLTWWGVDETLTKNSNTTTVPESTFHFLHCSKTQIQAQSIHDDVREHLPSSPKLPTVTSPNQPGSAWQWIGKAGCIANTTSWILGSRTILTLHELN